MKSGTEILLGRPIHRGESFNEFSSYRQSPGANGYKKISGRERNSIGVTTGNFPINYTGDSHLVTIAPTGAGKGRCAIIPNLLRYQGPVVVVDPKGENYAVTARARREMGQKVIKLDPFGITSGDKADSFNPFDILDFTGTMVNDEARMLAELVMIGGKSLKEPFWDNWASTLISGVAIYLAGAKDRSKRSFVGMRELLYSDDPTYKLAVLLDTEGKAMDPEAYQEMSSFLSIDAQNTRAGVLSTAQQYLRLFGSPTVREAISTTSFSLKSIQDGEPVSLYIIIPPTKLESHKALFRLWVGSLLSLIANRTHIPAQSTLFIIDEAAQLGHLSILRQAKTLLRGYGLQAWSFWQDVSQIKQHYQTEWATILNNCAVLQLFGVSSYMMATNFGQLVGASARDIRAVERYEQILVLDGKKPVRARRFDYLVDREFRGQYDPNPLYIGRDGRGPDRS